MDLIQQFESIVDALGNAGVEYAICGGFAVIIHGHLRTTTDIDVLVPRERLDAALVVLRQQGYDFDAGVLPFDVGTDHEREVRRMSRVEASDTLTVDLLLVTPVFDSVWKTRENLSWRGRTLSVVSREGLATMKRLAGRYQDLADLEHLGLSSGHDER